MRDKLIIIVPCYNEQSVLPITSSMFIEQLEKLKEEKLVSRQSKILFVDDGSKDQTWEIIKKLAKENRQVIGIRQSKNRGHQSSVLAGLMEIKDDCDMAISIDCDGQDDISAIKEMVEEYHKGFDIVYGVRNNRKADSFFKRFTAQRLYKLLNVMGIKTVNNHADYRLMSSRALQELAGFEEVNLFLRGLVPLIGFKSTKIYYERKKRIAGESHYSFSKMCALALDGITSLSIKPIRMVLWFGLLVAFFSFIGVIYSFIRFVTGNTVSGWASLASIVCFLGGVQMLSIGIIGEYIGKIYLETKSRPRYIISERTYNK